MNDSESLSESENSKKKFAPSPESPLDFAGAHSWRTEHTFFTKAPTRVFVKVSVLHGRGLADVTVPFLCLPCLLSYLLEDYFYICSLLPDPPTTHTHLHTHTLLFSICLNHTCSVFQVELMCAICVFVPS